ncbi:hypothetical protein HYFRA_00009349 [Hymenoscyphus fraxineus]|uniref:Uncharacterized protein n=1 Tax=Hymenoscyphus fraxineus TaxID=746836 RepID=A0A9N9L2U1_9HELO|nr:hypothetical protein HYFRA_00009349 [Hymenoscyphus fraxineus]
MEITYLPDSPVENTKFDKATSNFYILQEYNAIARVKISDVTVLFGIYTCGQNSGGYHGTSPFKTKTSRFNERYKQRLYEHELFKGLPKLRGGPMADGGGVREERKGTGREGGQFMGWTSGDIVLNKHFQIGGRIAIDSKL